MINVLSWNRNRNYSNMHVAAFALKDIIPTNTHLPYTFPSILNHSHINTDVILIITLSKVNQSKASIIFRYHIISPSWITALSWPRNLSNSMKQWGMLCRATRDGWVILKISDQTCYTEKEMANIYTTLVKYTSSGIH